MDLKNLKEIEKNYFEFELNIDKAEFDAEVMRVYRKNAPKMNVPGFRKGKAPKSIIEKMYGTGIFQDEALNNLAPKAYHDAIDKSGLEVVSEPEMELESLDENGITLKVKVYTKPEVEITSYKGLEVTKEKVEVTEEDINNEIESVRNRNSRKITVSDRPVEKDDEAIIDFEGFVDGVAFEGGKGEKYPLVIGSNSFIPGFEDQIIGKNIGVEFDVNVTFPKEYGSEELADKDAVFKVLVHEIKRTELPELDDEFVKDVSEFDTLEEYKEDIKSKINDRKEKAAEHKMEEELINALLENLNADIPAPMIEGEIERNVRDYEYRLSSQGGSLDMYFQYTGMTMENLRENFKEQSERQVKTRLALEKIVELENLTPNEEAIEEEYKTIASGYNIDIETVKKSIPVDGIKEDLSLKMAVDLIKDSAIIK